MGLPTGSCIATEADCQLILRCAQDDKGVAKDDNTTFGAVIEHLLARYTTEGSEESRPSLWCGPFLMLHNAGRKVRLGY